jgi:hypothetical protein
MEVIVVCAPEPVDQATAPAKVTLVAACAQGTGLAATVAA